ncbi:MAG: polyprenyl synthetase family protein [Nanoarchaeota archaeon]|nr:polyprenyl synthetase family protein [Nanoarchaeota archaeon]
MSFADGLEKNRLRINSALDAFLSKNCKREYYDLIYDFSLRHNQGKRLRPIAMILAYEACGKRDAEIDMPAIAIELHHSYSLILDDVMDEDETRWNYLTVYKRLLESRPHGDALKESLYADTSSRYAVSFAVMIGNLTAILSKKAMLSSKYSDNLLLKAARRLEQTDEDIYLGQMMDLDPKDKTEAHYLTMIKNKTGALFGLSLELGCLFAGASENMQKDYFEAGSLAASAFQIKDDLLDMTESKGHRKGSDILRGKNTLIIVKAFQKANAAQRLFLNQIIGKEDATEQEIDKAISMIRDTGAESYCSELMLRMGKEAKAKICKHNDSAMLLELFDYMIQREK